jgi:hypothetical protein
LDYWLSNDRKHEMRVYTVTIENDEITSTELWPNEPVPETPSDEEFEDDTGSEWVPDPEWVRDISPAVGPGGAVYGVSNRFRLVRYGANEPMTALLDLPFRMTPFNRPVVRPDGVMYVVPDMDVATLWAIDPVAAEIGGGIEYGPADEGTPGVEWVWSAGSDSGIVASTPVLTKNGNVYGAGGGNLFGLDASGKQLWRHQAPGLTYPSAMAVLSDGTLVVGGLDGIVYFLKEKGIENGGLAESGWPRAYHDNYHSNNAAHPLRWDRSKPAPYPPLSELLAELPADWSCNTDTRCYPEEYYETCDWGGVFDWTGKELDCSDPRAVRTPCPDPRATPCLVPGAKPNDPCAPQVDAGLDSGPDAGPQPESAGGCGCATVTGGGAAGLLGAALLLLAARRAAG